MAEVMNDPIANALRKIGWLCRWVKRHWLLTVVIAIGAWMYLPLMPDGLQKNFPHVYRVLVCAWSFVVSGRILYVMVLAVNLLAIPWALMELAGCFFGKKKACNSHLSDYRLIGDNPLARGEKDILERMPYVKALKMLIEHAPTNGGAQYIGVYGGWGDGKTSVRNQLEYTFEDEVGVESRPVFVDFAAWAYVDSDDLPYAFFKQIAETLERHGDRAVGGAFLSLADRLRVRVLARYFGSESVVMAIAKMLLGLASSETSVRNELRRALEGFGRRIIVVIDDLDRMPPDDVCKVIRLLKANGDLPSLTYLVLADDEYLAASIGTRMPAMSGRTAFDVGQEFLEKIVTLDCPLPKINNTAQLKHYLVSQLDWIHGRYCVTGWPVLQDEFECVFPYFDNVRSLKRLLNAYEKELAVHQSKSGDGLPLSIDPSDLLALTALRLKRPDVYQLLPEIYSLLLDGARSRRFFEMTKRTDMLNLLLQIDKGAHEDIATMFLRKRMKIEVTSTAPGVDDEKWMLGEAKLPKAYRGYRISSAYCFENYFMSATPAVMVPRTTWESLMAPVLKGNVPSVEFLDWLAGQNEQMLFLPFMLNMFPAFDQEEKSVAFVATIAELASRNLPPTVRVENYISNPLSPYERLFLNISDYCQTVSGETDMITASRVFIQGVKKADGFSVCSRVLLSHPSWLSKDGRTELADWLLKHLEAHGSLMFLQRMPDSEVVLAAWGELLRTGVAVPDRCHSALSEGIADTVLAWVPAMVFAKKNTRKGGESEADVDLMKQVFTMEEIRVICNSLEQSQHVLADNTPRDLLRKSLKAQISRH